MRDFDRLRFARFFCYTQAGTRYGVIVQMAGAKNKNRPTGGLIS